MRALSVLVVVSTLACSGREPPGIHTINVAGYPVPDAGAPSPDVALADASDAAAAPSDVFMVPEGAEVPDFALPDLNPASRTYQMTVRPSALRPKVTVYYFANAI